MTAQVDSKNESASGWLLEPSLQPKTYPGKWDLSAFQIPDPRSVNGHLDENPGSLVERDSVTAAPHQEDDSNWQPEPFPEPRTFPSRWDMSELG